MSSGGRGGASNRARAGKFTKAKRGGGRNFSKNLRPLDADGAERSMWAEPQAKDDDDNSSEEDSSEEESSDDGMPQQSQQSEMTREQRRAAAKAKKEAAIRKKQGGPEAGDMPPTDSEEDDDDDDDDDMPANPNLSAASRKQVAKPAPGADPSAPQAQEKIKISKDTDKSTLSRREREALEAQQKKERYQKLHAEGKTEEARADLERLKLVRQQREEAAGIKAAEKVERDLVEREKREQMERMERQMALKSARGGRGGAKKGGKA
ncbi:hypothetical protein LTR62_001634 [Meristemomyces frigidus]|uniref:Casein kinase substrate phosphoprotein PP28 domain-containing protein n=1 Tax=Meristemomyces frigidus TaxID=1508187 RepID=A0AAN7T967_9PEZI|nr:hypothetical protein LTR62_001634 [Meristemomyces frigidus]